MFGKMPCNQILHAGHISTFKHSKTKAAVRSFSSKKKMVLHWQQILQINKGYRKTLGSGKMVKMRKSGVCGKRGQGHRQFDGNC